MLRVDRLAFSHGTVPLFKDLSFNVHPGQRVGLTGRNGTGKSTLFGLILGTLTAESGDLDLPSGWRIATMEQEATVTDEPAIEFVQGGNEALTAVQTALETETDPTRLAELHTRMEDLDGYTAPARAAEVLHGLGFDHTVFDAPFSAFSGGWRIRLNLARTLMTPCDLLLLDEPTNHLDLEAIVWLEQWLNRFPGTVLLISHDRSFLDSCTEATLHLSRGSGELFNGNYTTSERIRAERLEFELASQAKRAARTQHIQAFVDRFRAKASKARQVQSRIKALERLKQTQVVADDSPYRIRFQNTDKVSNPLISMRAVELGYDSTTVLTSVSQSILPGDRIGVLGENGAGKSTLLKALVGELNPSGGDLARGKHCATGYFAQHQLETLDARATALDTVSIKHDTWTEQQVRDYLGGWGFPAEMIVRPVATLSGGEKARLVLALIASEQPAILVLDEPTNHLDLDMRDALAMALQDFTGAVIMVAHDRTMLDRCVDEFWLVQDGSVQRFQGDLTDYTKNVRTHAVPTDQTSTNPGSKKHQRRERALKRGAEQSLRKEVSRLERDFERLSTQVAEIEQILADTETYQSMPADDLDRLLADAARKRSRLESVEEEWLKALAALEESQQAS